MTQQITWNSNDPNMTYLKTNNFVKDTNDNLYVVGRKSGYLLNLIQQRATGSGNIKDLSAIGDKWINVDPTSSEYDSENEYFTHEINGHSTLYELFKSKK